MIWIIIASFFAQDSIYMVEKRPSISVAETGRHLAQNVSLNALQLGLTLDRFAVLKSTEGRFAAEIGDLVGRESALILAVGEDRIILRIQAQISALVRQPNGTVWRMIQPVQNKPVYESMQELSRDQ